MEIVEFVKKSIENYLAENELFLVDITFKPSTRAQKLEVLVDGLKGVTIDQCAEISRKVGSEIEDHDLIQVAYNLEVSSPGIDKPFKVTQQYTKNIGRDVVVITTNGDEIQGNLTSFENNIVTITNTPKTKKKIEVEPIVTQLTIEDIKSTKLIISF